MLKMHMGELTFLCNGSETEMVLVCTASMVCNCQEFKRGRYCSMYRRKLEDENGTN